MSEIFEPYDLVGVRLKNRMVTAPMTLSRAQEAGWVPTALTAEYGCYDCGAPDYTDYPTLTTA